MGRVSENEHLKFVEFYRPKPAELHDRLQCRIELPKTIE